MVWKTSRKKNIITFWQILSWCQMSPHVKYQGRQHIVIRYNFTCLLVLHEDTDNMNAPKCSGRSVVTNAAVSRRSFRKLRKYPQGISSPCHMTHVPFSVIEHDNTIGWRTECQIFITCFTLSRIERIDVMYLHMYALTVTKCIGQDVLWNEKICANWRHHSLCNVAKN